MKSLCSLAAAALLAVALTGCAGKAVDTTGFGAYGAPVAVARPMTLTEAIAQCDELAGAPVQVTAKVDQVCQSMGCWMTLTDGESTARVRFTASESCADGYFVPRNASGHMALLEGTLEAKELDEDQQYHYAVEAGMSEAEIAKIKGTKREYTFVATGVMLSDKATLDAPAR